MNRGSEPVIEPTNRLTKKIVELVANATPHCHDITRLLSQSMERRLHLHARLLIRLHLSICVWCKRYDRQLKLLRKCSSEFAEKGCGRGRETLPSSARERLNKALDEINK